MHMDMSQEPLFVNKWLGTPLRHRFCASLRSRNAHGHFSRALLFGNCRKNGHAHLRGKHFVRACAVEMLMDISWHFTSAILYGSWQENALSGVPCYRYGEEHHQPRDFGYPVSRQISAKPSLKHLKWWLQVLCLGVWYPDWKLVSFQALLGGFSPICLTDVSKTTFHNFVWRDNMCRCVHAWDHWLLGEMNIHTGCACDVNPVVQCTRVWSVAISLIPSMWCPPPDACWFYNPNSPGTERIMGWDSSFCRDGSPKLATCFEVSLLGMSDWIHNTILAGWWFGCHQFYFPIYWESHHPNWRNHIFQRGDPTTNQWLYTMLENDSNL